MSITWKLLEEKKNKCVSVKNSKQLHLCRYLFKHRLTVHKVALSVWQTECPAKVCGLFTEKKYCIADFTQQTVLPYYYRGEASGWFKKKEVKAVWIHITMSNNGVLDVFLLIGKKTNKNKNHANW